MDTPGEVVFHRRGLALFYFAMGIVFPLVGVCFFLIAVGEGNRTASWSDKWEGVVVNAVVGLSWLAAAPSMWTRGKGYRMNEVRIGVSDLRFQPPDGKHYQVEYSDIRSIKWNPKTKVRTITLETSGVNYSLNQFNCPRIKKVAHLLGERCVGKMQIV